MKRILLIGFAVLMVSGSANAADSKNNNAYHNKQIKESKQREVIKQDTKPLTNTQQTIKSQEIQKEKNWQRYDNMMKK